jgi:uncharacterized ferritin-like protein (DUF455 family)
MKAASPTLQEWARELLESGSLEAKLRAPPDDMVDAPGEPVFIDAPARVDALRMRKGGARLPKLGALRDRNARAVSLARFAHHELSAVELFAWALLAFPELPAALRRGFVQTLVEEQLHLRLYLDRLAAHDDGLEGDSCSDYLWRHVGAIRDAAEPAATFLSAMGLTFEQANLDYSALYADAFAKADDLESAAAMRRVHDDEIGHVALAARWLPRLVGEVDDLTAYERTVPFPLGASRAKGRRFDAEARRAAGLSERFIAHVEAARPSHQRPPSRS